MPQYSVQNQGIWTLGGRTDQDLVAVDISSNDEGQTFTGTITYAGEGPLGFKATRTSGNSYNAQVQWGGNNAPWHEDGIWVMGMPDQRLIALNVTSTDDGQTLDGTDTYSGEGPIDFKGTLN